jgi:hypothetical protein
MIRSAAIRKARCTGLSHDHQVVLAALLTIAIGIWIDTRAHWFSQPLVDLCSWAVLFWILARANAEERTQVGLCVLIATVGEYFLGFVWGLYDYRLGNLPLFIPAGHGLVYAAGRRLKGAVPSWLSIVLAGLLGFVTVLGASRGWDRQALIWYPLFLCYLWWSRDRALYTAMFPLALAIESYGTWMGGWSYHVRDPWFGLSTITRPPVWTGTFYCTLDALVVMASRMSWPPRLVHRPLMLISRRWAWSQRSTAEAASRTAVA